MKDLLEIIIITYNREKNLSETLNKILSESSPVKDCKITILDNNSTDGTKDLCKSLISKFPNIIYFKNNFNVGLSGNILKAMEIPTEKYFWILCDNDEINFENWYEVESAMKNDCDLIVIANSFEQYCKAAKNYESPYIKYLQCHLCSAAIYKTSIITDDLITLATYQIPSVAPHLTLVCEVLNSSGKVAGVSSSIIVQKENEIKNYTLNRISKQKKWTSELLKRKESDSPMHFYNEFLKMIEDKSKRKEMQIIIFKIMPYFKPENVYAWNKVHKLSSEMALVNLRYNTFYGKIIDKIVNGLLEFNIFKNYLLYKIKKALRISS